MAHLDYFLFCEDVTVDDTGKNTLVGIFDTVAVSETPIPASIFKVVFSFMPEEADIKDGSIKIRVVVKDPEDRQRGMLEVEARPKDDDGVISKLASYLDIGDDFVIKQTGIHKFYFYINDTLITTRELNVIPVKEAGNDAE